MTVPRIEWQCPGCRRKFAIPDQPPRPKLCPECQRKTTAATQPPASQEFPPVALASSGRPVFPSDLPVEFADYPVESAPRLPATQTQASRPIKRRRYEVLRSISLWFKVLAVLGVIELALALVFLGKRILAAPPGEIKTQLLYVWFVTLIVGVTAVLLIYSFAVLLLVAMDIEHNTRDE